MSFARFLPLLEDQRGNVAISFAFALLPLMALAGTAVDYSHATAERSRLQAATDAAALNAARSPGVSDSQRAALAQSSIPTDANAVVTSSNGTVMVKSTKVVKAAFMNLVGISEIPVGALSVAIATVGGPPVCVMALNRTANGAVSFAGNTSFVAPNCAVYSNSSSASGISVQGSATVQAAGLCSVGGVSAPSSLTPAPQTSCLRRDDPFRSLPQPATAGCDYNNTTINPNTTRTLSPGIYCGGLNMKGTVILNPGLYIIKDGPLAVGSQANVSVSGSGGVTFYLTGPGAGLDMDGSGGAVLSAQTTGPYAGLLVIQDALSNAGATSKLNGNSGTVLRGGIYLPTQTLSVTGNNSFGSRSDFMPIIADQISFSGSSAAQLDLAAMKTPAPDPDAVLGSAFAAVEPLRTLSGGNEKGP